MNEYHQRLNRVIDYIDRNLDKELTLNELADISCFSRFHFNRIFSSLMGETLFQFIQRLRLEKAATLLCSEKRRSILEIALICGYSSPAAFSKSFRRFYGVAPSEWNRNSNSGQMNRNGGKDPKTNLLNTDTNSHWRYVMEKKDVSVEVKEIEPKTLAYIRYIGPYAGDEELFARLYNQLFKWAGPRNLISEDTEFISIYHDNPEITDEKKLRVSICLTVPQQTVGEGDINIMTIPGGRYAVGHFEIDPSEYGEAWSFMCGEWLSNSGFEPDDRPCFELMVKDPKDHPENKHTVDIYEPVRPM